MTSGRHPREDQPSCIGVVILNWNEPALTLSCLNALVRSERCRLDIIVVDNGSTDDSHQRLGAWENHYEGTHKLTILNLDSNLGFTGGVNRGIRELERRDRLPAAVLLLNNDAIVGRETVWRLSAAMEAAGSGVVGATIFSGGRKQFTGVRSPHPLIAEFFSPLARPGSLDPEQMDAYEPSIRANGAAMLIRREVLEDIQHARGAYLDDRLFLYYDELEFCERARDLGYDTIVARDAKVEHAEAATVGGMHNPISYYYQTRNRIILARDLLPLHWQALFHPFDVMINLGRVAKNLLAGRPASARAVWDGFLDAYRGRTGKWRRHDVASTHGGSDAEPQDLPPEHEVA